MKTCTNCKEIKPESDFYRDRASSDGYMYWCKSCKGTAEYHRNLKRRYDLTIDDFDKLFESQGSVCAICGTDDPGGKGRFHVDHCHETGDIRGLLCHHCNLMLGQARDSTETLMSAIHYLNKHKEV